MNDSLTNSISKLQALFLILETPVETLASELCILDTYCKDNAWLTCTGTDLTVIYVDVFGLLKVGYIYCLNAVLSTSSLYPERLKSLVNGLYAVQCQFTTSMLQCEQLQESLHTPFAAANLALAMSSAAGAADRLDARLSLPIWKSLSSLMQQFKNELRRNVHDDWQSVLRRPVNFTWSRTMFLDDILQILLESIQYFFSSCEEVTKQSTDRSDGSSAWNTKLKMLNLLTRIGTFCIHEFASIESADQTKSEICTWLNWMITTRHAGGLFPSGTGLAPTFVERLNSSLFLSVEMLLSQMVSLQPPPPASLAETGRNQDTSDCPCIAQLLISADMKPAVKCRIYAGMLVGLTRQQQCYHRWVNKKINLYHEFLKSFAQINDLDECYRRKNTFQDISDESMAITGEFYIACLKQICASICGLPKLCFSFLEEALINALFYHSELVALLSADIWCFLARYGTGDLCWQYVMMLTGAIRRILNQCSDSQSKQFLPVLPDSRARGIKRIGRLVSRLVVFLTPKQQLQLLHHYPLHEMLCNRADGDDQSLSVWHLVPLSIDRLQKSARSLATSHVSDRLKQLTELEDVTTGRLLLEGTLTVQLVTGLPMDFRIQHASELARLVTTLVRSPRAKQSLLPSLVTMMPFNHLIGTLAHWLPDYSAVSSSMLTGSTLSNSQSRLLSMLVSVTGPFDHPSIVLAVQGWTIWLAAVKSSSNVKHSCQWNIRGQHLSWLRQLHSVMLSNNAPECPPQWICQPVLQKFKLSLETLYAELESDNENTPPSHEVDLAEHLVVLDTVVDQLTAKYSSGVVPSDSISHIHRIIDRLQGFATTLTK